MLAALNTVRFRAVVSICGVNITEWGLENACLLPTASSSGGSSSNSTSSYDTFTSSSTTTSSTSSSSSSPTDPSCLPFSIPMERETHPLFTHFGDYTNRVLTAIDIFKGFTGVAYPMDIITRELIYTIQKWKSLPILPIDKLRGISY